MTTAVLDEALKKAALAWTEATDEDVRSFVNTIPTRDGGTHEQGLRGAVTAAVQRPAGPPPGRPGRRITGFAQA